MPDWARRVVVEKGESCRQTLEKSTPPPPAPRPHKSPWSDIRTVCCGGYIRSRPRVEGSPPAPEASRLGADLDECGPAVVDPAHHHPGRLSAKSSRSNSSGRPVLFTGLPVRWWPGKLRSAGRRSGLHILSVEAAVAERRKHFDFSVDQASPPHLCRHRP